MECIYTLCKLIDISKKKELFDKKKCFDDTFHIHFAFIQPINIYYISH